MKDQLLQEKIQVYTNKLNQKEDNVQKTQAKRNGELIDKINEDNIKRFERRDTVYRIQKQ